MNLILLHNSDFSDDSKTHVRLTGERMNHIISVFKASTGQVLKAGLLNGPMGSAQITSIKESYIDMSVKLDSAPPPPLPLTLILALPRPKSLKKTIEAATTLGIKTIYIIESWRVEKSYWSSPELLEENLNRHIFKGLEQARDTIAPQIHIRRRFKPFLQDEIPDLLPGYRALVAHPYNGKICPHSLESPAIIAVGPEGGFIPYEIELFCSQGFEIVSLGERILRVEQAVPAIVGRLY